MLAMKKSSYSSVRIDGCRGKWIAVYINEDFFEVEKFRTINDICYRYPNSDSYIIDIPIGLVENKSQLRPDMLVKKELGKKGSSIFEVCKCQLKNVQFLESQNVQLLELIITAFFAF
jgi:predicted RNase H-like nuclease